MATWPEYETTRYRHLGVSRIVRRRWRFVCLDFEGGGTSRSAPAVVGPVFSSKAEAFGALEAYAEANYPERTEPLR